MDIVEYNIVHVDDVNQKLKEGWQPYGNPFERESQGIRAGLLTRFIVQPMVKRGNMTEPVLKNKTVYGLTYINNERTVGNSDFFDTYDEALNAMVTDGSGTNHIYEYTYRDLED